MSRSVKKVAVYKDTQHRSEKRAANKKVRKTDIENYKGYAFLKKLFNPWNICDWKCYTTDTKAKRK